MKMFKFNQIDLTDLIAIIALSAGFVLSIIYGMNEQLCGVTGLKFLYPITFKVSGNSNLKPVIGWITY
jgi:hypothetical protein